MRPHFLTALALLLGTLGLVTGCSSGGERQPEALHGTGVGIDIDAMNKAVAPGDDFYLYANGTWQESAEIPADLIGIGSFYQAWDKTRQRVRTMVEELAASPQRDGSEAALVARYYNAFTDVEKIDKAGFAPVRRDLRRFAKIGTTADLSRVLGEQLRADADPLNYTNFETPNLFGLFVTKSLTGEAVVPYLLQGGLGLPERDYYLAGGRDADALRRAYRGYLAQVFELAGYDEPKLRAARVFALEIKIAQAHQTRKASYDITNRTEEWQRGDFATKAPGIDWPAFFDGAAIPDNTPIAAFHETAIPALSALVASEPIEAWQDWLVFHQIDGHATVMPSSLRKANFEFAQKRLFGREKPEDRPLEALRVMRGILGDALGSLYVERHFPAEERRDIEIMVERVKDAFAARIEANEWMAEDTKRVALEKVRTMEVGIGGPDHPASYDGLRFKGLSVYAMTVAAEKAQTARQIAKIGKPFDRREWWLAAHEVNALNLPVQNAMNFPAALLQRPFYDPKADAAFNYGAVGSVIGHEIVHSFDNVGAAFDNKGMLRNWWSEADGAEFARRGKSLADQFSAYKPFPDLAIDGELTLSENIADLVGLQAAYDAYHASLDGKEPPVIEGFTGDQRFFIAYGQSNASKVREKALRDRIKGDGHAPGSYRAQTVRNLDAWYRAFDVQPGTALYLAPEDRVVIF